MSGHHDPARPVSLRSPAKFRFSPRVVQPNVFRRALRSSDRIICVSEFTRARLHKHFSQQRSAKAVCIPNSIQLSAGIGEGEARNRAALCLAVAQHRANKNLALLLEAFSLSKQSNLLAKDARLVIVGSAGPETSHLQRVAARLSISKDVLTISGVSDESLYALYRDCELFVSLSDIEGFGLPVVEALLARARVVASDIAIHREVAGDHCEYVNLNQANVAQAVTRAMQAAAGRPRPSSEAVSHFLRVSGKKVSG